MRNISVPSKIKIFKNSEELTESLLKFFVENRDQKFLFQYSTHGAEYFSKLISTLLVDIDFKHQFVNEDVEGDFDWIFSIGGGRTLDISKLKAKELGADLAVLPTLIAHDGICSPVAVVDGVSQGSIVPTALFVDYSIIKECPIEQIYAGVGDLVANLTAIEDWYLASQAHGEEIDDFAIMLSRRAARSIISKLELNMINEKINPLEFLTSYSFVHVYIESLALSGIAMSVAGNSRPCSGAEHLISHAIDEIYGANTKALHGIQVMIAALYLEKNVYGFDILKRTDIKNNQSSLKKILGYYGMPTEFQDISINKSELDEIIKRAPSTRKGRLTVLDKIPTD